MDVNKYINYNLYLFKLALMASDETLLVLVWNVWPWNCSLFKYLLILASLSIQLIFVDVLCELLAKAAKWSIGVLLMVYYW